MQDLDKLVQSLEKRRIIAVYIVILFAGIALLVSYNYKLEALRYFDGVYNQYFTNGLIIYKLLELIILYYILFQRYLIHLKRKSYDKVDFLKLKKHTKLLLFLIPQGNTIFGIIAYKLSGSVLYFFLFSFIALASLILVKPSKLKVCHKFPSLK